LRVPDARIIAVGTVRAKPYFYHLRMSSNKVSNGGSANGKTPKGDGNDVLPIWKRPTDFLYLLWYFNFLFAVMFTDIHNFTASMLGRCACVREIESVCACVYASLPAHIAPPFDRQVWK